MAKYEITEDWVDRYLRDELDDDERDAFELELMDSPELSKSLAAAMGMQQALELDEAHLSDTDPGEISPLGPLRGWRTFALAASLVLAVFSTTMYWRTSHQLSALQAPVGQVLTVPVEVMRSANDIEAPRAVAIPDEATLVLFDIEIPADHSDEPVLNMRLSTRAGQEIMSWQSNPLPSGNHNVAVRASQLPQVQVVLEARNPEGELIYRRLLEFR